MTDSLYPSKGYWVKTNQSGAIDLKRFVELTETIRSSGFTARTESINDSGRERQDTGFIFRSGKYRKKQTVMNCRLLLLLGSFDARFATNRMVEPVDHTRTIPMLLSSAVYPVTIKWDMKSNAGNAHLKIDDRIVMMHGQSSTPVTDPASVIALEYSRICGTAGSIRT